MDLQNAEKSNDAYKAALDGGAPEQASGAVVQAMDQVYYSPSTRTSENEEIGFDAFAPDQFPAAVVSHLVKSELYSLVCCPRSEDIPGYMANNR